MDALRISHAATANAQVVAWHPAHAALHDDPHPENVTKIKVSAVSRHNQNQGTVLMSTDRKRLGELLLAAR